MSENERIQRIPTQPNGRKVSPTKFPDDIIFAMKYFAQSHVMISSVHIVGSAFLLFLHLLVMIVHVILMARLFFIMMMVVAVFLMSRLTAAILG